MRRDEVFERLAPPPFGLERLRAQMEARRSVVARRLVLVMALATVVVTLVAWPKPKAVDLVGEAAGLLDAPSAVSGLGGTAVQPVSTENPDVVIARVASLD